MRTTIEIKPEHRARLLELAARRGEKGFSGVVGEALDSYFSGIDQKEAVRHRALRLKGTLSGKDAKALRQRASELREFWR